MKRTGIRRRVVFAVTFLLLISFALLGAVLSVLLYSNEKKELLNLQNEIAGFAANEMHWDIHELQALLGLAVLEYERAHLRGISDAGFLSQVLMSEHVKHHNIMEELSLIDKEGRERVRVSRVEVFRPEDLRDLREKDEFTVPSKTGETYFGPVTFESGTFIPHMTMSLPVKDIKSGSVLAVLVGKIRLHRIWENAVQRSIGKTGIVFITDENGKVLAHPDPSVIYRNTFFTAETSDGVQTGLHGERIMHVSRKVAVGNRTFFVHTSLPTREAVNLSLSTLSVMGVFLAGFVFLSISLCLVALNHMMRPIETLADSARKITAGDMFTPVLVRDGDEIGDMSSAFNAMTSRLLETIDSLEARNILLYNILNALTHPFYVIDARDYTIKLANPAAGFGDMPAAQTCYALTHKRHEPCSGDEHPCIIELIKQTGESAVIEHAHYDEQGNTCIVEIHGYPIFDKEHNVVQVIEYVFDITARKRMEEDLHISEQKNRTITTTAKDAIIMMDEAGRTSFWNPAAEKIFGYTEEEVMNRDLHTFIIPERYLSDFRKSMEAFRETGEGAAVGRTLELVARRKDGSELPVELSLSAIRTRGKWQAVGIFRDITQRKQAENRILASLEEKEVLLQEIHHSVKNNMQVITSLLDLQLGYVQDRDPQEIFSEIKNRIKSMALVHEKLYMSKDLSKVDFSDYLETLINNLYRFYNVSTTTVALNLDARDIALGIDMAIPCGLIVNELVTNSLKYAFPGGRTGEVLVKLMRTGREDDGRDLYELTVKDNGIGIPQDLDLTGINTLGLYLVTTLVEHQLQGTVSLNRTGGTEFIIRFKALKYKKRV
ncbi:MAG: PAS domain S-box protein [Nitrospirae bacterium]|nr:PAS domain S-box protein [Nitrospirota bacterium]